MNVVGIRTEGFAGGCRNLCEVVVLGGSNRLRVAVLLRFLIGLGGELTGQNVIRLAGLHQVQRNCRELRRRAALQEKYLVVVRNVHDGAEIRFRLLDDCFIRGRSVAHFHNGHACITVTNEFGCGFFQYGKREHRRTCGEIVNSVHDKPLCIS